MWSLCWSHVSFRRRHLRAAAVPATPAIADARDQTCPAEQNCWAGDSMFVWIETGHLTVCV